MAGAFALGFDSVIATSLNMFPQYSLEIMKSVEDNKIETARKKQKELNDIIEIVTRNG